jgi:ribA/ribD-fused uncharacterized protein
MEMINSFTGEYRFLSNFSGCTIYVPLLDRQAVIARTAEHAYQAYKTTINEERMVIITAPTPGEAKRRGQKITLRPNWEEMKIQVMRLCVREKFKNSMTLAKQLVDTEDHILEEGNTWGDTYWGTCRGVGQNWLGFILMGVRAELRGK